MCQIGEKVVHINGGVFIVKEEKIMNYGFGDINYLILKPYYTDDSNKTLVVYVPEDKKDELIRKIMSREEALQIIENLKKIEPIWYQDLKIRKEKFGELVKSRNINDICVVVKSLYVKQLELQENNKSLNLLDFDYLNKLKKGIEEELAISLNMSINEINDYITNMIK